MIEDFKTRIFDAWAPADSPWTVWTKPVLFATLHSPTAAPADAVASSLAFPAGVPPLDSTVGLVIDLPGADSVHAGLDLALRGWRPVPLFNAVPFPIPGGFPDRGFVAVSVGEIAAALVHGAEQLSSLAISPTAPPAFLLDSRRRGTVQPSPGDFDNRSVSFPSDFPSASFLKQHGIRSMTLIQSAALGGQPQPDLAHTLRRWQESGLELSLVHSDQPSPSTPLTVERPSHFKAFWYRFLVRLRLKPTALGGYGGLIATGGAG